MTHRERSSLDERAAAPPRPAVPPSSPAACPWDDLFANAPPAQQRDLLALAGRQGVLYAHQLHTAARRPLLPALLNGHVHDLTPLHPADDPEIDPALDPAQRQAVLRALHTPDICLIQGGPGTGKSRVAAEVIARAAARGERVLLLAASAAALDRVLEELARHERVFAVRGLGAGERPEGLSPCVRRLTFAERLRAFEERTLHGARREVEECRRLCETRAREEAIWCRLEDLAARREQITVEFGRLNERLAGVAAAVEADCAAVVPEGKGTPSQDDWNRRKAAQAQATAGLEARLAESRAEAAKRGEQVAALEQEHARLGPLVEARRGGRWWAPGWWRARFAGNVVERLEQVQKELDEYRADKARAEAEVETTSAELDRLRQEYEAECAQLRGEEEERRRAAIQAERAALESEQRLLDDKWAAACRELSPDTKAPAEPAVGAVREARAAWDELKQQAEARRDAARQWADAVERAWPALPERFLSSVNVAAATTAGLAGDPQFGDRGPATIAFDLLVLEEADQVTESEFLHAARRAGRFVLLGEPAADPDRPAGHGRHAPPRQGRPSSLRPGFFQRLWHHLHDDPRRLPYAWVHRDGRLVCRLLPAGAEQEGRVESERVADRPDVELRIVSPPGQPPQLAEVVFPGSVSIAEAKEYIFRELEELPVQARGPGPHWEECDGRLCLVFQEPGADAVEVPLEKGVRERVAPTGLTYRLEFDRAEGWDHARAAGWVEEHLKLRLLGRTTALTTPHRMQPALASVVGHLLAGSGDFPDLFYPARGDVRPADGAAAVEFVAVPGLNAAEPRRRGEPEGRLRGGGTATVAPRSRAARGGAGLELDLTDRRFDSLPGELRTKLPAQGLVNYLEAQALIRSLEALVSDAAFRARAEAWSAARAGCGHPAPICEPACATPGAARPALAVIALYPAQVELLRRLIERSAALAACGVAFEVGLPSDFRQRECLAALVSLTRSHTHRAVTFGEGPHALTLALTRAADRLMLFGDPGTLARRAQWSGPVDHLDESAAARERALIARLSHCIHEPQTHAPSFRLRESCSV